MPPAPKTVVKQEPQDQQDAYPPDPYPDYPRGFAWFFQSWVIMFLAVICIALVFYLLSYIPG